MSELQTGTGRAGKLLRGTGSALAVAKSRRDARVVFFGAAGLYLVTYLFTVGDLAFVAGQTGPVAVRLATDLSRAFASLGFFRFGAIATVTVGPVTYLFSPGNALVAGVLSSLVGANVALTYLGLVQSRACGIEAPTGLLAGLPALLSGAACCGPTILLVIGIQASATIVTGFQLLVPVAVAMLLASLLLLGRTVDSALL